MKTILLLSAITLNVYCVGQNKNKQRMAAIYGPGYYVSLKGDTTFGSIQVNPESETEFYHAFNFLPAKSKKGKVMNTQKVKAYGYNNKHFVCIDNSGDKIFVQRLTFGRLRFYEYKTGSIDNGVEVLENSYFIRDLLPESRESNLSDYKRVSKKYYKKTLKPYLKDQPAIWSDLDKFSFDKDKVINAIEDFNKFYVTTN